MGTNKKPPLLIRENDLFLDPTRVIQVSYTIPGTEMTMPAGLVERRDGSGYVLRYGGGATLGTWIISFNTVRADPEGIITDVVTSSAVMGDPPQVGEQIATYLDGMLPRTLWENKPNKVDKTARG